MQKVFMGLVSGLAALIASSALAAGTAPMIVVFRDDAQLQNYRGYYHADQRAKIHPEGWRYLKKDVVAAVQAFEGTHGFKASHVFSAALRGFSAPLTPLQIHALQNDPAVEYIEPDGVVTMVEQVLPWGIDRIDADISSTLAGDGAGTITNVNIYVIDTGIDAAHTDLNVVRHVNYAGGENKDCNGHGTHVAGIMAARDDVTDVVGAAPGAPLTAVKVLDCSGSGRLSGVVKGIDWVTANAIKPAVANLSLSLNGISTSLDNAVRKSANRGIFYSIAAGNDGKLACSYSPARTGAGTNNGIMTVAAVDSGEAEAAWSNYGKCIDIWAPGVSITSTQLGGGTTDMSGTSMAAPHAGGVAAIYLSTQTTATSTAVEMALKASQATPGTASKDGRAIARVNAGAF